MVYDWKREMPVKAQEAGEHLEKLEKQYGSITPRLVLETARSEDDLLHPCFEWNDGVAAEKYRESQAGYLIRNLIVVNISSDSTEQEEPAQPVRAYVNVSETSTGSFVAVKAAMSNEVLRNRVLDRAIEELEAFKKKYSDLKELAKVFSAIKDLVKSA